MTSTTSSTTGAAPPRGSVPETSVRVGASAPLGPRFSPGGVNFSVFSKRAAEVDLLLFDRVDDAEPARVLRLDPAANRTYHYWHLSVPGIEPGQIYGFRVHGPFDPSNGDRFDSTKVLLDPYGRGVAVPAGYNRAAAHQKGDNAATAMKSVVVDTGRVAGSRRGRRLATMDRYLARIAARHRAVAGIAFGRR